MSKALKSIAAAVAALAASAAFAGDADPPRARVTVPACGAPAPLILEQPANGTAAAFETMAKAIGCVSHFDAKSRVVALTESGYVLTLNDKKPGQLGKKTFVRINDSDGKFHGYAFVVGAAK